MNIENKTMQRLGKKHYETKYVYIPNEQFWVVGNFFNLLKNDCYYKKPNKRTAEKTKCLEMLKRLFEDKILKEEDYDYLLDKYWFFYKNVFPVIHIAQSEREIIQKNLWKPAG